MPRYQIFRLTEQKVAAFRARAPIDAPIELKPNWFEPAGEIEAAGPYEAWKRLQGEEGEFLGERRFGVGDAIEDESATLLACNYWGFDPAVWSGGGADGKQKAPLSGAIPSVETSEEASAPR